MHESHLPTVRHFSEQLSKLVANGLGDLPMQVLVGPDSTIQAIAKAEGNTGKPAIMVEFPIEGRELGVIIITADRLTGSGGMPSTKPQ